MKDAGLVAGSELKVKGFITQISQTDIDLTYTYVCSKNLKQAGRVSSVNRLSLAITKRDSSNTKSRASLNLS